jgi:hypothetical protein
MVWYDVNSVLSFAKQSKNQEGKKEGKKERKKERKKEGRKEGRKERKNMRKVYRISNVTLYFATPFSALACCSFCGSSARVCSTVSKHECTSYCKIRKEVSTDPG